MKLIILGSSSKGNCYILDNGSEALVIECGVQFRHVQAAMAFNTSRIVCAIMTHEHGDHAKFCPQFMDAGIPVFASAGTLNAIGQSDHRNAITVANRSTTIAGGFAIMPFDVVHDAAEPFGFIISHYDTGKVLFLTDTTYSPYKFADISNMIIETNYSMDILKKRMAAGMSNYLSERIMRSHMNLETCKSMLMANDLSIVHHIVLIHLSDRNSDAEHFHKEVYDITGKSIHIADAGMTIENFNKSPF